MKRSEYGIDVFRIPRILFKVQNIYFYFIYVFEGFGNEILQQRLILNLKRLLYFTGFRRRFILCRACVVFSDRVLFRFQSEPDQIGKGLHIFFDVFVIAPLVFEAVADLLHLDQAFSKGTVPILLLDDVENYLFEKDSNTRSHSLQGFHLLSLSLLDNLFQLIEKLSCRGHINLLAIKDHEV